MAFDRRMCLHVSNRTLAGSSLVHIGASPLYVCVNKNELRRRSNMKARPPSRLRRRYIRPLRSIGGRFEKDPFEQRHFKRDHVRNPGPTVHSILISALLGFTVAPVPIYPPGVYLYSLSTVDPIHKRRLP